LGELPADETQPSDFVRALNLLMDNLENVVVNFERTLSLVLEKIEKLESLEKSSRDDKELNGNGIITGETKQLTNDATTSVEMPLQETSETHTKTKMTTNIGTNPPQFENVFQEPTDSTVEESGISKRSILSATFSKIIKKVSSKSNYFMLAIALAILGIVIVKLCFILLP